MYEHVLEIEAQGCAQGHPSPLGLILSLPEGHQQGSFGSGLHCAYINTGSDGNKIPGYSSFLFFVFP